MVFTANTVGVPASVFDQLFRVDCLVCGRPPAALCDECRASFSGASCVTSRLVPDEFSGVRFAPLDGAMKNVLIAIKDQRHTAVLSSFAVELGAVFDAHLAERGCQSAVLVPIPSSRSSWQARGFNLPRLLADSLRRHSNRRIQLFDGLHYRREVADQRQLSADERASNLEAAFEFDAQKWLRARHSKDPLFVVDDVLTTGSTLSSARAAMLEKGIRPTGFLVFAETILKNATQKSKWV